MGRAEDLLKQILDGGEAAIDRLIEDRESESYFLDFKRSADNGAGKKLHQDDRFNLNKTVSGFGNSERGIVVWGVECKPNANIGDVAKAKIPIQNPERFKSWLESVTSGATIPPHTKVEHHSIQSVDKANGFVVTLIPRSFHAPHQTTNELKYFIRSGSSFSPAPHGVLIGLFGRAPQPHLKFVYRIAAEAANPENVRITICFCIINDGGVIAFDPFIVLRVLKHPGSPSLVSLGMKPQIDWIGSLATFGWLSLICPPGHRLSPDGIVEPAIVIIDLCPPFTNDLMIEVTIGCRESEPIRNTFICKKEVLIEQFNKYKRNQAPKKASGVLDLDLLGAFLLGKDTKSDS